MGDHRGTKTSTLFTPQERFHVNAWTEGKLRTGSGSQKGATQIRFLINWFEYKLLRSLGFENKKDTFCENNVPRQWQTVQVRLVLTILNERQDSASE